MKTIQFYIDKINEQEQRNEKYKYKHKTPPDNLSLTQYNFNSKAGRNVIDQELVMWKNDEKSQGIITNIISEIGIEKRSLTKILSNLQ